MTHTHICTNTDTSLSASSIHDFDIILNASKHQPLRRKAIDESEVEGGNRERGREEELAH